MNGRIPNSKFQIPNSILIPAAIALASFLLYLRTLAPDVVDADGGEFQFATWNFGFVHPTGYPLFLILGGLFQHLVPLGNPAYRLNLFTAITAAVAVAMVYLVANSFTQHRGVSIIVAGSFALTRMFWYDAGAAETYALNAFFVALLIFLALRWQANPSVKSFGIFCFGLGLALTHHRTIILWIPGFLLFFAIVLRQLNLTHHAHLHLTPSGVQVSRIARHFILCTFSFLLPLLLYLYIPLRAPASPYAVLSLAPNQNLVLYENSLPGFINYFLGRAFQSEIGWDAVSVARLTVFPQILIDQFGAIGVAMGVLGFAAMVWHNRQTRAGLALLLTGFAATILFASVYHIGDIAHYYIPAYLVWAVWVAVGIQLVVQLIQNSKSKVLNHVLNQVEGSRREWRVLNLEFVFIVLITLLIPAYQFFANLPYVDRSGETMVREQWTRILASPLPPNAILISNDRDEIMPMWYMQYVENTRRDVLDLFPLITPAPAYANVGRVADKALSTGRPVYFIKEMRGMEIKYNVVASGPLWRVTEAYQNRLPQNTSGGTVLGERVRVLGYDVTRHDDTLSIAVYWNPIFRLVDNYTSFVHVLDAQGNKIAQAPDHQVGGEFYPTSLWQAGETLRDEHTIQLPPNLAQGTYQLRVGMYRQRDGEMLGEPVVIGTVEIK